MGWVKAQPIFIPMNLSPSQAFFTIEPANLNDLGGMRAIEQACFPLDAWPLLELIGALSLPGLVRLKATVDGRMVGFVGGMSKRSKNEGWITTLGVLPGYRRMGIANALLDECEKTMAMPTIRLTVRKSNLGALQLYRLRGYSQVEIWEHYYEGGEDGLVLEKKSP
jgi:ribosomal-protein-alanine N-acetyltransferase